MNIGDLVRFFVTLLIGIYTGIFFGEAKVVYECGKEGAVIIKGTFWNGERKYFCSAADQGGEKK